MSIRRWYRQHRKSSIWVFGRDY